MSKIELEVSIRYLLDSIEILEQSNINKDSIEYLRLKYNLYLLLKASKKYHEVCAI